MIKINPQEILELVRAGYTKEEINSMLQPEQQEQQEQTEPEQQEQTEPEQQEQTEPEQSKELNALKEELSNLKKLIQKQNIDNSGKDSPPPLTASDALASLITKK